MALGVNQTDGMRSYATTSTYIVVPLGIVPPTARILTFTESVETFDQDAEQYCATGLN